MFAKRVLVLMLVVGLAAFAVGCGGKQALDEPEVTTAPPPEPPTEPPVIEEVDEPEEVETPDPALNDVFYAFDKYNLTDESKGILEDNADELKRASQSRVTIEGHCDERGTKSYNLALGEKRAKAAKDYLVALGINGSRITIVSYGKERPFDPGHSEAAWAKNRRAHFVLKK
jgi:peptidoglycan-associated lipoprotein